MATFVGTTCLRQETLEQEIAALGDKCSRADYSRTPEHIKAKDAEKLSKAQAELQAVQELVGRMADLKSQQ